MSDATPPADRILAAAEVILRRYGVEKTNVVDIARELGISHTNIYRHFPSKKALMDAVAARWLHAVITPLEVIARDQSRPPTERLILWFNTLRIAKQRKVLDDPELFRVYHRLAIEAGELASTHVTGLIDQVEGIITEGISLGEFSTELNARASAKACLQAMAAFHHPAMLLQGHTPLKDEEAHVVLALMLAGLRAGPAPLTIGKGASLENNGTGMNGIELSESLEH